MFANMPFDDLGYQAVDRAPGRRHGKEDHGAVLFLLEPPFHGVDLALDPMDS